MAETLPRSFCRKSPYRNASEKSYCKKVLPEPVPKELRENADCNPRREKTVQKSCPEQCLKISIEKGPYQVFIKFNLQTHCLKQFQKFLSRKSFKNAGEKSYRIKELPKTVLEKSRLQPSSRQNRKENLPVTVPQNLQWKGTVSSYSSKHQSTYTLLKTFGKLTHENSVNRDALQQNFPTKILSKTLPKKTFQKTPLRNARRKNDKEKCRQKT